MKNSELLSPDNRTPDANHRIPRPGVGSLRTKLSHNVQLAEHISRAPSDSTVQFVLQKYNLQIQTYICEHDTKPSNVILSQYISTLRLPKRSKWQQTQKT